LRTARNVLIFSVLACLTAFVIDVEALPGAASAQSIPNPTTVVRTSTFVSLNPLPQGQTFEAAVVIEIQPGFHMNSHKPSEDYLIPTTVTADACWNHSARSKQKPERRDL